MLQPRDSVQEFLLQPGRSRRCLVIPRAGRLAAKLSQSQLSKLAGLGEIVGLMFEMNGQLFARVNPVLRIGYDFLPDFGGLYVMASAFGHHRQLALRLRPNFGGQPDRQRLCAS